MHPEWEAALQKQRERVLLCAEEYEWLAYDEYDPQVTVKARTEAKAAVTVALDNALRLARAIGAAEALWAVPMTDGSAESIYRDQTGRELAAIIRELEGA